MQDDRYPYVDVVVRSEEAEQAAERLWELGATGIEERDHNTLPDAGTGSEAADPGELAPVWRASPGSRTTLRASFASDESAEDAVTTLPRAWQARLDAYIGDSWRDQWRRYWKPQRVGQRLLIRPSWESHQASPEQVVLTLDPGRAFGTGLHASTRLALAELETQLTAGGASLADCERGPALLDLGCGSGILAIAGLLLGAPRAVALDVDEEAVEICKANAELNRVALRLHASTQAVGQLRDTYPLVVANIEAGVLAPLAGALSQTVRPGGRLILSGLLLEQRDEILDAYTGASVQGQFELAAERALEPWLAITLARVGDQFGLAGRPGRF